MEVARRVKKQLGEKAKAGPCRDQAIPAAGEVDNGTVIDDNIDLDADVEIEDDSAVAEAGT